LGAYGNIATAYPDYEMQESLFEIKNNPLEQRRSKRPDLKKKKKPYPFKICKIFWTLLKREFKLFWQNKVLRLLFIGAPLLYVFLLGYVYGKGK
jgi:hypothetical protein